MFRFPLQLTAFVMAITCNASPPPSTLCPTSTSFLFSTSGALGGSISLIQSEGQPLSMAVGIPVAPIIINTVDVPDGTVVTAYTYPSPVILSGNIASVIEGCAYFPQLMLGGNLPINATTNTTAETRIVFSATDASGQQYSLSTGIINQLSPSAATLPNTARLMTYGFLRHQAPRFIPNGAAMGDIYVGAFDYLGNLVSQPAVVTVTLPPATQGQLSPANATFSGAGAILIKGLTYTGAAVTTQFLFSISFGTWSVVFTSPDVTPLGLSALTSNAFIGFASSSYVTVDNYGATGVMGVPFPPFVIQMLNSELAADPSNTGLIVSAYASQGTLIGGQALVVNGVASFSNLYFAGDVVPPTPFISFTVSPIEGQMLNLSSGMLTLTNEIVRADVLAFARWSEVNATMPSVLGYGVDKIITFPLIVVQLLDSAFNVDHMASGFMLALSADPPGLLTVVNGSLCQVRYGLCAFPSPVFEVLAPFGDTFNVRLIVSDATGPTAARAPLSTGTITIVALPLLQTRQIATASTILTSACQSSSNACPYQLSFVQTFTSLSSAVYGEGVSFATTVGSIVPMIRIQLLDTAGPMTNLSAAFRAVLPVLYAHTGASVMTDNYLSATGQSATISAAGEYIFTCLSFAAEPPAAVQIAFTPYIATSGTVLNALTVGSGLLRVASAPIQLYQMQFAPPTQTLGTPAVIGRELQPTTAVLNVALPPIAITVADSQGVVNTLDSAVAVTVVATASTPDAMATVSAPVVFGVAVFQNIIFTSQVDDVSITFTAYSSPGVLSAAAVVGQTLQSGNIRISSWPAKGATHMSIVTSPSDPPETSTVVTSMPQSLTVANLTDVDLYAEFTFRDSMHTIITPAMLQNGTGWFNALDGLALKLQSRQVIVYPSTFYADASCACVRVRVANLSWASDAYLQDTIFIDVDVVIESDESNANPYIVRQQYTLGPIQVGVAGSPACTATSSSATVVAEFMIPPESFEPSVVVTDIGLILGVSTNRISFDISTVAPVQGIDHSTLQLWSGSSVVLSLADPVPGDINPKPGTSLASELVAFRSSCGPTGLLLKRAYLPSNAPTCNGALFDAEFAASENCTTSGAQSMCSCYAYGLLSPFGEGPRCVAERYSELLVICVYLANCVDPAVVAVCSVITPPSKSYVALYVGVVALACVFGIGAAVRQALRYRAAL